MQFLFSATKYRRGDWKHVHPEAAADSLPQRESSQVRAMSDWTGWRKTAYDKLPQSNNKTEAQEGISILLLFPES